MPISITSLSTDVGLVYFGILLRVIAIISPLAGPLGKKIKFLEIFSKVIDSSLNSSELSGLPLHIW